MTLVVSDLVPPGLSLTVGAGEIVALAGHDTGRTAVVQAIAGLVRPRSGSITIAGEEVAGAPPDRIARLGLSYVPSGRRVFAGLTVDENLTLGAYRDRSAADARRARAYALFPRLADRPKQPAGTLSGGEQQMLVIARGLMTEPRILILDEPSAGLGPPAVEALAGALEAIRDAGTAVLIADEGLRLVRRLADRILLLEDGRVVLDAARDQALADPRLGVAYLSGSGPDANDG
jgi:ABC-type branched-subunit amino acid transport system ATPase component